MQKQNFEQQVQDKMNDLALTPSASVWPKVEDQIRNKKDRRRILFWLLPLLLATGISSYWWMHLFTQSGTVAKQIHQHPIPHTSVTNPPINSTTPAIVSQSTTNNNQVNRQTIHHHVETGKKKTQHNSFAGITANDLIKQHNIDLPGKDIYTITAHDSTHIIKQVNSTIHRTLYSNNTVPLLRSTYDMDHIIQRKPAPALTAALQATTPKLIRLRPHRWEYSLLTGIGFSAEGQSLLSAFNTDKAANLDYNTYPGNVGSPPSSPLPPSTVKKGLSYHIGIAASRSVSKRLSVSAGLQYAFYSTQRNAGTKITDSMANGSLTNALVSYRNTDRSTSYTNRYQFFELPVGLQYQLLKKQPLLWSSGISVTTLWKSKALQYHPATNTYTEEKNGVPKIQVGWWAGLQYRLPISKAFSISAGPQFYYRLQPLQKGTSSRSSHLAASGIEVKFSWK